jgi:hypothetical protein
VTAAHRDTESCVSVLKNTLQITGFHFMTLQVCKSEPAWTNSAITSGLGRVRQSKAFSLRHVETKCKFIFS